MMHKENLIEFLRHTNLVSFTTAKTIADSFTHIHVSKNDFLLTEGKLSDEYLFLETGHMRSFAHDTDGNEVTTNFYCPGQMVFEVSSFFNRTRSKENIQAITDSEGWSITYKQLNELFHALPEFREFGRSMLVKGFTELKTRMLYTITESAEDRYEYLLKNKPEIFHFAPLKYVASYLGITDTSLSRIRKDLAKK